MVIAPSPSLGSGVSAPSPLTLDCSEHRPALTRLLTRCLEQHDDRSSFDDESRIEQFASLGRQLPSTLLERLSAFRTAGNKSGALLLTGLPHNPDLPATPLAKCTATDPIGSCVLGLIATRFGEMFGYQQLDDGAVFRNVFPLPEEAWEQSAKGSRSELELHTEQTFHPHRPRFVFLLGLRGAPEAYTTLCSVRQLTKRLAAADRALLSQPLFSTGIDYAFGNVSTEKGNGPRLAVLSGELAEPCLTYDADLMVGVTPEAVSALGRFNALARRQATHIHLDHGTLIIIDNWRAAHGRTAFEPRFDGSDRWLLQAKTLEALPTSAADRAPGSRVIHTAFD
jgi:L-asparagine oxygenase